MVFPAAPNAASTTVDEHAAAALLPSHRGSETSPYRMITSATESALRFVNEYVREWQPTDARSAARLHEALHRIEAAVNGHDVAVFEKPGGLCPFCRMAVTLLRSEQSERGFSLFVGDLLHDEREGLKLMLSEELGERVLTYPIIYIRGTRVRGGYEELKDLADSADGLAQALENESATFEPPDQASLLDALPKENDKPRLCYQAGGGQWLTFQTLLFGNVLRLNALFQVVLCALAITLYASSPRAAALVLAFVGVDAALFVLFGPSPLAPLGTLATQLIWSRRGSVASAVPYKFTFALYAVGCLGNLACAYGDGSGGCSLPHGTGLATTLLVNSSILAVFRF